MDVRLDVMKEALRRAQIINAKGQMTKDAKWKLRRVKNRFGDIALFELWDRHKWPNDWQDNCGYCGKGLAKTKIQAQVARKIRLFICWNCYKYGKQSQAMEGLK